MSNPTYGVALEKVQNELDTYINNISLESRENSEQTNERKRSKIVEKKYLLIGNIVRPHIVDLRVEKPLKSARVARFSPHSNMTR